MFGTLILFAALYGISFVATLEIIGWPAIIFWGVLPFLGIREVMDYLEKTSHSTGLHGKH